MSRCLNIAKGNIVNAGLPDFDSAITYSLTSLFNVEAHYIL